MAKPMPPLGIRRKEVWQRDSVVDRVEEIRAASIRYMNANMPVPIEWVKEMDEHLATLKKIITKKP